MDENGAPKVSSLFTPKEVMCGLESASREECIHSLAGLLLKAGAVKDADAVAQAALDREKLGATIVAPGLAVPHARMEGQERIVIALATSRKGIPFKEGGDGAANLVIMIITGAQAPGAYLQALAAIVRAFADPAVIGKVAQLDTAEAVWEFFDKGAGVLPAFVTARDMMSRTFPTLKNTDTLALAIDTFCREHVARIPILDEDGDFVGIVGEEEILKLSLPEYLLWMEDLEPILHFEPFGQTLKDEHITLLEQVLSADYVSVSEDTPAIQVARKLMQREVRQVFVTRGKKLVGTIRLSNLLQRVFRG